jgi:Tol biopolymer transport system component
LLAAALLGATPAYGASIHPPDIRLLSQTAHEMSAEGHSNAPIVNLNGLVTAYSSNALDLVSPPFTNFRNQVYARDLDSVTSQLVSVPLDGRAGNRPSQASGFPPGISGDGRFVAFSSLATNLVEDDTGGLENVFVYDRSQGTMELISRGLDAPSNGASTLPKISADGRFVVFQSTATNLVSEPGNAPIDVYVFDRVDRSTRRVSVASDGTPGNGQSITPNISDDGLVVAFASRATNLTADPTPGTFEQIFVHELSSGGTEMVSVNDAGTPGNATSFLPDLTADGSQVAFKSEAFNLVPNDTNGWPDVFVRDRPAHATQRVSVDDFGNQSNGLSGGPGISADGRFVAFPSFASNFVPDDGNGQSDVYVYDRFPPPPHTQGVIARVTVGLNGDEPNDGVADFPATISADGRWIGFASAASNLVPNDQNNDQDAFLACNPFDQFNCAPPTPTPSLTPTPTPTAMVCVGDCNGDGQVSIDDLIRMVNIALGLAPLCPNDVNGGCLAGDANCDCTITVDEIIRAVRNALNGCTDFDSCSLEQHTLMCCAEPPVTHTPTATRTITPTPPSTPTATPDSAGVCVGDCDDSGAVSIDELVRMVSIALGLQSICPDGSGGCLAGDPNCDCDITVNEIIQAVVNALNGCTFFNTCDPIEHEMMCCQG